MQPYFNFWILQLFAMMLTLLLIPRLRVTGISGALLMVGGIALVNAFLWDAELFYALPKSPSMNALMLLLANGVIFWLLVKLLPGIEVEGVLPALIAPVVFTCCAVIIHRYGKDVDWGQFFQALWEWTVRTTSSIRDHFQEQQGVAQG